MAIDFQSHPAEMIGSGEVGTKKIDVKQLRDAIPDYCFEPSYAKSLGYLARDLTYCAGAVYLAYNFIPMIPNVYARFVAWALYGVFNGMVCMGLWVLGHECGHGAFSKSETLNNVLGLTLHASMMTPYFAWRSTHRRHHIYANNLAKDHNYVPPKRDEYAASLFINKVGAAAERLEELTEDAPMVNVLRIIVQQLVGFPYYLLTNVTAAPTSLPQGKKPSENLLGNSHFAPSGVLFRPEEFWVMAISDAAILVAAAGLWYCGTVFGHANVCLLYLQPYMWVNHWIVAITYLHHTHPDLPKYDNESWAFIKGATSTVDRQIGVFGRHFMHNIMDFHVIHHLFSRIPFYYGPEATQAVMPILGDAYHSDKERAFFPSLYETFTKCLWVEVQNPEAPAKDQYLKFNSSVPATATATTNKGNKIQTTVPKQDPNWKLGSGPSNGSTSNKRWFDDFRTFISNLTQTNFRPQHGKTA